MRRIELIDKREFAAVALDENAKTFMIYVATLLTTLTMQVHPSYQAQVGLLLADKVPIKVSLKDLDYNDVFSFDIAMELSENTSMNEYIIELIEDKQYQE